MTEGPESNKKKRKKKSSKKKNETTTNDNNEVDDVELGTTTETAADSNNNEEQDVELGATTNNNSAVTENVATTTTTTTTTSMVSREFLGNLPIAIAEPDDSSSQRGLVIAEDITPIDDDNDDYFDGEDYNNGVITTPQSQNNVDSRQRPSLISVRCYKATRDSKLGITFKKSTNNGSLQINYIVPNGSLADSPLKSGDLVIAIDNNRHCSRWTISQALEYLMDTVGYITILVSNPSGNPNIHEAVVYKSSPEDKVGVFFRQDEYGKLRINRLNPYGLIGEVCAITEGDYVESINNTPSQKIIDVETALTMVRSATSMVSIVGKQLDSTEISIRHIGQNSERGGSAYFGSSDVVVVDATANELSIPANASSMLRYSVMTSSNQHQDTINFMEQEGIIPHFVYVKCDKPSVYAKLGISFNDSQGHLEIQNINSTGVLGSSPLKRGFHVLSIDGKVCTGWNKNEALDYLQDRQSGIAIVARNPVGSSNYVVAQATKPTPRSKIGIFFRKVGNGPLTIGDVSSTSIFAGSVLNKGFEVILINGIPSRSLNVAEAVSIVEDATDAITIVAKTNSTTGIVLAWLSSAETALLPPPAMVNAAYHDTQITQGSRRDCNICSAIAVVVCIIIFLNLLFRIGKSHISVVIGVIC